MKQLLIVMGFIFFSNCITEAQDCKNCQRYFYNYKQKKVSDKQDFTTETFRPIAYKAGKDIQFVISNYNPLKVQILINDTAISRFLEQGEDFGKLIVLPSSGTLSTEATPLKADGSDKAALGETVMNGDDMFTNLSTVLDKLKGELTSKHNTTKPTSCDELQSYSLIFNQLSEELKGLIYDYKTFVVKTESIKDQYNYLKQLDELTSAIINTKLGDYLSAVNSIEATITTNPAVTLGKDITDAELGRFTEIDEKYKKLKKIKLEVDKLEGKDCKDDFARLLKDFLNNYMELKSEVDDFYKIRTDKGLASMSANSVLYDQLKTYLADAPETVTYAMTVEKDKHTIKLYEKSSAGEKILYDNINIEPKAGWKLDFSAGIFFSGLNDKQYTITSIDSFMAKKYATGGNPGGEIRDTFIQRTYSRISENHQSRLSFGGMLYLNFHTQNPGNFNWGVHLGMGALFNDQTRLAVGCGGSVIIGKSQRLSINIGGIMAQVTKLSEPYETNVWYPQTITAVPTWKAWAIAPSLGLSWNFK